MACSIDTVVPRIVYLELIFPNNPLSPKETLTGVFKVTSFVVGSYAVTVAVNVSTLCRTYPVFPSGL